MSIWQTIRTPALGRHSHDEAYVALVLSGGYEEAGDQGRFQVEAGDVVLHDRFEAHLDRFTGSGAVLLNLPLAVGLYSSQVSQGSQTQTPLSAQRRQTRQKP